ncbi:ferritin-like domain-containing protein [Melittangium boletus]|uniref:Ferritin n=1 Tax=Melittangium boletus DSM 14713 TaxID=1294270 RepID=A0A250II56_9BACT|nr:ferritin-like domain-containing protein [Melittangium boletus]ATB30606.1 ferritin [Melittangium boletus DSM 14713]
MHPSRLRLLFARTLRASLVTPLVLTGGGGIAAASDKPPAPREATRQKQDKKTPAKGPTGYVLPACDDDGLAVSGLKPAEPSDFVQLRRIDRYPHGGKKLKDTATSSSGTACATATHPEECKSALEHLDPSRGFRERCEPMCVSYYLALTRGDEVAAYTSFEALKRYLGSIDTAPEAVLLAFANGLDVTCDSLEQGAVKTLRDGSFQVVGTQGHTCWEESSLYQVTLKVTAKAELTEVRRTLLKPRDPNCGVGRRPDGLHAAGNVDCDSALGRHFAQAAHLEAASIRAFLRLREELARHGANEALCDAALASAVDEVRHTEESTRLARRFGALPPRLQVEEPPARSLFEVALENTVEGCTRETYGALVAHHQALHARDEDIRGVMSRIAEDETRHAELSWAIDRWAHERLSEPERASLRRARRQAVETLREELAQPRDADLVAQAGLPTPEVAASFLSALERELWA